MAKTSREHQRIECRGFDSPTYLSALFTGLTIDGFFNGYSVLYVLLVVYGCAFSCMKGTFDSFLKWCVFVLRTEVYKCVLYIYEG